MEAMEKIYSDFSSPHFWVSVILVGIVINLVSARVDRRVSDWWSSWSKTASLRSEKKRARDLLEASLMRNSETLLLSNLLHVSVLLGATAVALLCALLLVIGSVQPAPPPIKIILLSGGMIMLIFGMVTMRIGLRAWAVIKKVVRELRSDVQARRTDQSPENIT